MGLLLMAFAAAAAPLEMAETPRLRRFGAAEGMPSRMVLALAEDRQGHVWAATDGGLVRYDGNGLRVWEHDPEQPGSLPGNEIETLLVDLTRDGCRLRTAATIAPPLPVPGEIGAALAALRSAGVFPS